MFRFSDRLVRMGALLPATLWAVGLGMPRTGAAGRTKAPDSTLSLSAISELEFAPATSQRPSCEFDARLTGPMAGPHAANPIDCHCHTSSSVHRGEAGTLPTSESRLSILCRLQV